MITVFGSLNVDFVTMVAALPAPGETVLGPGYVTWPGGKGANQALAAARAGARTALVGAVGNDASADIALGLLRAAGVDLSRVRHCAQMTGAAFITVDAAGANQIVVAQGANRAADADQLQGMPWQPRDWLLLQGEVSPAANLAAAQAAKSAGLHVILNLAPAFDPDPALLAMVDILIVNAGEALHLARTLSWPEVEADAICARLDRDFGLCAIATLGADGVIGWRGGIRRAFDAFRVDVVDTTAAGDAFVGAFAAASDKGFGFVQALQYGVAAGALACTVRGAQPSLPDDAAITALLGDRFL